MSKFPSISVIVPVYNEEKHIGRCLRSVIKQTIPDDDYEIIVINDGSTDRTSFVLGHFEDEIILINNDENMGLPASLNKGINRARGQFIVRVDADDYVHWEYLNILMLHLRLNNDIDAIACDYFEVDEDQNILSQKNCMEKPIGCGIMFKTDQLLDVGLYDESFLLREEEDLRARFIKNHVIGRVKLPLYRYLLHGGNSTNDQSKMDLYAEKLKSKHIE